MGWRLITSALRTESRAVVVAMGVGIAWTAAKVIGPLLVQGAIDDGIEVGARGDLTRWAVLILLAGGVQAGLTGYRRYLAFKVARRVETTIRDDLFAHLQRLHFAFHDRAQTGQLMSRANTDLSQIQAFVAMVPIALLNIGTVASVAVVLVTINPTLTVLALGCLPFVNVLARRFGLRLHPAALRVQAESAELASVVEESVSGVRVVKGLGAEASQAKRLRVEADDVYESSLDVARIRSRFIPALELVPNLGLIVVLAYGGHLALDGDLTLGSLVAFNVYVVMLIWPLRMMGMVLAQSQRAIASAERVGEVLAAEPRIVDAPHSHPLPAGPGEVRFEGVTFRYPTTPAFVGDDDSANSEVDSGVPAEFEGVSADGSASAAGSDASQVDASRLRPVLDRFDLLVRAGESVALVGATGSGKTTVARLIPRFYDVESGHVLVDGADVRTTKLHDLRRAVGIVFEDTFLFSDTVSVNIAFGDPDASASAIERAARLAGAHDFIAALPDGYGTVIGERGYTLSGGQRQRIAIARAILADPRVLILDDATSAVDPTKEHEIRDALTEVMAGRTTIVIAHRPATIALADRVVLLGDGRIVADGTHDELLASSAQYREVLAAAGADARASALATIAADAEVGGGEIGSEATARANRGATA